LGAKATDAGRKVGLRKRRPRPGKQNWEAKLGSKKVRLVCRFAKHDQPKSNHQNQTRKANISLDFKLSLSLASNRSQLGSLPSNLSSPKQAHG
jgi:hypothetical protein